MYRYLWRDLKKKLPKHTEIQGVNNMNLPYVIISLTPSRANLLFFPFFKLGHSERHQGGCEQQIFVYGQNPELDKILNWTNFRIGQNPQELAAVSRSPD